jgi:hypothetical protein
LKSLFFAAGMLLALSAHASFTARAALVGQHLDRSFAGDPLLICEYAGSRVKFEILSQNGKCAPYITVQ